MTYPFFDGHNDSLLRLALYDRADPERLFLEGRPDGHLDLARAREAGMIGGLFALFAPSPSGLDFSKMRGGAYECALPPELPRAAAWDWMARQIAILNRVIAGSEGAVRLCRDSADVAAAEAAGSLAVVLHAEGAEAIDPDLVMLEVLHALGLRSLGPVWSRPTIFASGVPMAYPASPDIGPGLTEAGTRLIRACNRMRILIDLSHLNEAGFWDVARLTEAPLVATHSNVHALCASSRNLTDRQLDAVRDSGGLVGVNLATCFLRADGQMRGDTPLDPVIDHFLGLIERVGEGCVALGSDFDGAIVPREIGDVTGVPRIFEALERRGVPPETVSKLSRDNWLRVLKTTIG